MGWKKKKSKRGPLFSKLLLIAVYRIPGTRSQPDPKPKPQLFFF